MRVGRAFLQTFAVQVVQSLASVATGVVIARGLGPSEQGRFALFSSAVGLGALVAALGQFHGNVLSAAEHPTQGRIYLLRSAIHCVMLVVVLVIVNTAGLHLPTLLGLGDVGTAFIAVLCVEALAQMVRGINLGQHDINAFNLGTFLQRAAFFGLVLFFRQTRGLTLLPVVSAWFVAALISALVSGAFAWRRSTPMRLGFGALGAQWGANVMRGFRALICVALSLVLVRCDVYMLGPMLGMAAVGQVSVATYLAEWLWYVPSILNNLLFAAAAADALNRQVNEIARATRALVALLVPACLVLMLSGKTLVHLLYGPAYSEAGTLFVLLLPGATGLALHQVVDSYFAGRGFPAITIWAPGVAVAAKVSLNLLLIPHFGVPGAVCATSFVYMGLLMIKIVALCRERSLRLRVFLWPSWQDIRLNLESAASWMLRRA